MARLNHKGEYWSHLESALVFRDLAAGANENIASAAAKGATLITVDDGTNYTNGDPIRIGTRDKMEFNEITTKSVDDLNLRFPLAFARSVGEACVEQEEFELGHVTTDGVTIDFQGNHNAVPAGTKRLVVTYLAEHTEFVFDLALLGFAQENWALAVGQSEDDVDGSGTEAAPTTLAVTADDFNEDNDLCWRFTGKRKDDQTVLLDLWACEVDFTAISEALRRGAPTPVPIRGKSTSGLRVSHHT
jgi:hypothetical protein